jgi:hypothetical protein
VTNADVTERRVTSRDASSRGFIMVDRSVKRGREQLKFQRAFAGNFESPNSHFCCKRKTETFLRETCAQSKTEAPARQALEG